MDLPAILGGPAVRPDGPPTWPLPDPEVLDALHGAFRDGAWGKYHGGRCYQLIQTLAAYHQLDHVLLCGSGTYAIELGLRALQVGPGDEVIQAAYDYDGNFYGIHAVGAMPVLVDVDPRNGNLALDGLEQAVSSKTKVLIVSHLHGGIVPMRAMMDFARARELKVLEDAAQCPGGVIDGRKAGTWGDVGVLSFGGSKLLGAGRGGALLTPHAEVAQRARTILQRGNNLVCPLSELQATVLLPQLTRLDDRNRQRRAAVQLLEELTADIAGLTWFANPAGDHEPGYYKAGLILDEEKFSKPRAWLTKALRAEGIALDEGYSALHVGRSPRRWRQGSPLDMANRAHRNVITLHHPVLLAPDSDLEQVALALRKLYTYRDQ